ncbi:phosphopantetheine-binding protein [Ruminiclostridium papyrosolvens DSM 2782]|uniref:Phosphopantetheine-binding protein n=1 Tax=Ruminiclostridium papyrosolvens DSM 2782 TaxID=588581 RepID=F1T8T6_9FIRM|nr:phosphopantetheine-binding protein [Ruminiclostridium papyrosolvens]EGD48918.1 phosphopantetheine-binding protein [Ruminiclostridium papyrosolvens DSM 2782]
MEFRRSDIINILSKALDVDINVLSQIGDDEDIGQYGLESIRGIQAMVLLEDEFDIELIDEDLLFENINTINKIKKTFKKNISKFFCIEGGE